MNNENKKYVYFRRRLAADNARGGTPRCRLLLTLQPTIICLFFFKATRKNILCVCTQRRDVHTNLQIKKAKYSEPINEKHRMKYIHCMTILPKSTSCDLHRAMKNIGQSQRLHQTETNPRCR